MYISEERARMGRCLYITENGLSKAIIHIFRYKLVKIPKFKVGCFPFSFMSNQIRINKEGMSL